MVTYVCIIFGTDSEVLRTESLEVRGDGEAGTRAIALRRSINGGSYELWREGRKISAFYGRKNATPWFTNLP